MNRWRTRIGLGTLAVFVALAQVACGSPSSASAGGSTETFNLRLSGDLPTSSAGAKAETYFAQQVKQLTNGHVNIQIFPLSQLGTEAAVLTGVQTGSIDFADVYTGSVTGQLPTLGLYSLPFLIRSENGAHALYNSNVSKTILTGLTGSNLTGLLIFSNGPFEVIAVRPINTPNDFHGLKIRTNTDAISVAMLKVFGATAVPLPSLQVYSALQQGTATGTISAPAGMVALKWYEVAKELSQLDPQWDTQALLASPKTMSRLPRDYQNAIMKAVEATRTYNGSTAAALTQKNLDLLRATGTTFLMPDKAPFRTIAATIYDQFANSIGAENLKQAERIEASP